MSETPHKLDLTKELAKGLTVHSNVKQEMIVTTIDRLRLCLISTLKNAEAKGAWIGPLGLLLGLLATLVSADFKDFLLSKDAWQITFMLATGAAAAWLFYTVKAAIRAHRSTRGSDSIESIVESLKVQSGSITVDISEPIARIADTATAK